MKNKFNKRKILIITIADLLIFAVSLLTFAYFDHVRTEDIDTPVIPITPPNFDNSAEEELSGDFFQSEDADTSKDASEDTSKEDTSIDDTKGGIFTDGEIISTENMYKSKYVSIEVKEIYYKDQLYMVQDVYVKHIESLGTGFAKGVTPLSGEKSTIYEMVEHYRNNGYNIIAAINGDYCGYSKKGATVRNGILYWTGEAQFDVCVIYKDGTMATMSPKEFDAETEIAKGAWHVWDFGPILLDENSKAYTKFSTDYSKIAKANPRTAIGYYEPGHYCFVTAGGRGEKSEGKQPYGVTMANLASFMESLNCKKAYNLDGGRSSIMVFGDKIVNEKYQDVLRSNTDMVFIQDFPAN